MRDVFDTDAVQRDSDDPFVPAEKSGRRRSRTINWHNLSHALMPVELRDRAITASVRTDKDHYAAEETVHFRVVFANRIPFPVSLRTRSPVLWDWAIDGVDRASELPEDRPDDPGLLRFGRSERKTFDRRWNQRIQDQEGRWKPVGSGEYTLTAWINVEGPADRGLHAETSFTVE